jgi:hypothetical protein
VGVLPDGSTTYSQIFTLNGGTATNMYPYFTALLVDQTVPLMSTASYSLPSMKDSDAGDVGTVQSVFNAATNLLPAFVTLTGIPTL